MRRDFKRNWCIFVLSDEYNTVHENHQFSYSKDKVGPCGLLRLYWCSSLFTGPAVFTPSESINSK